MADIKQDLLSLQYSSSFALEGIQEANIDLELPPAALSATVYGTVTDGTQPLADATVKLFDSTGTPYRHTLTDGTGAYSFSGVPAGTYSVAAVKDGFRLSDAVGVTLTGSDSTQINLACVADATLALGAIAGTLMVTDLLGTSTPLGGAKITLENPTGTVVAATYTAADGEFAFYDVADGVYTLRSTADGYQSGAGMTATVSGGSIVNVEMTMTVDSRTYNGTVSGVIRDNAGLAVAGCFVGLYRVVAEPGGPTKETLIAVTKTNATGSYLFGGVLGGQYMVKAKLER